MARGSALAVLAGVAGFAPIAFPATVQAAAKTEPIVIQTSPRDDQGVDDRSLAPVRGLEPRFARDLVWTRMSLADDLTPLDDGSPMAQLRPSTLLDGLDLRANVWTTAPNAMPSMATAATSLVTSGLSMFKVFSDGRLRQRHSIRCFFRSSGIKLAWRIEF